MAVMNIVPESLACNTSAAEASAASAEGVKTNSPWLKNH